MTDLDTVYMDAAAAVVPAGWEVLGVWRAPQYAFFFCARADGWRRVTAWVPHSATEPSMFADNIRRALEEDSHEWARHLNRCKCPAEHEDDPCPLHPCPLHERYVRRRHDCT